MVNPINGSGRKIIIVTKPPSKDKTEKSKDGGFDKVMTPRGESEAAKGIPPKLSTDQASGVIDPRNFSHLQRLEDIARQIRDGTYKMTDPMALAERLLRIAGDKSLRAKFVKKVLAEEADNARAKNRPLTELDLKKLIMLIKDSKDETFNDEELEEFMKEFA